MLAPRLNFRSTLLALCLFLSLSIPMFWYVLGPVTALQTYYPDDSETEVTSPNNATESRRELELVKENFNEQPSLSELIPDTDGTEESTRHESQSIGSNTSSENVAFAVTEDAERLKDENEVEDAGDSMKQARTSDRDAVDGFLSSLADTMIDKELEELVDIQEDGHPVNQLPEQCTLELRNRVVVPEEGTYQPVVKNVTWLMSAHVDHRYTDAFFIRVFGLSTQISSFTQKPHAKLYCQLWDDDRHLVSLALSGMRKLYSFGFRIESFQMECVFERNLYHKKNTILSLTTKPCDKPNNAIFINDNHRPERSPVNYTVCICGPTKYNYSDYQRVIEWMELNRILGAGRTIIYNVDTSRLVQSVFNYYRRRGELEVYNVNPPYIYGDQRWIKGKHEDPAYAKMSMRHDCIMREMFKTRYVVFLDLDENIVPRISDDYTWDDMIKSTGCENDDYIMAGNVHFRRNWGVDYMVKKDPEISFTYRLLTLMTTYRDEMFFPPMTRSKYMVKPETVAAASTHRAFLIGGLKQPCLLRTHIGALHHYKYRNNHINDTESVRDRTMFKYRDLLLENVARAYRDLRKDLELFDIFV